MKQGEQMRSRVQIDSIEEIKEYVNKHFYQICVVMSVLLVTIICLWNIGLQGRVRNIDDEIGYWGIAAQMAGYSWKDIMSNLAYYSFGYSILLVPIFWLHRLGLGMAACYKVAIVLNIIMLDATIPMALYVAEKWAPKINKYYRLLCVLAITLYSNNIMQTNTGWPEICVYFLYWCILALAIKVFDSGKLCYIVTLIMLSIYMFTVHMRTIALPIAVVIVVLLWFLSNHSVMDKRKLRVAGIAGALFFCILIAAFLIMGKVQNNIYHIQENTNGTVNTFSSSMATVFSFFTLDGLKDLILGCLGKMYYQGIASYLLSYLGMGILIKTVYLKIKRRIEFQNKKVFDNRFFLAILILLSEIGSVMVSAIFMSDLFYRGIPSNDRADRVVYGRYTEFLISVLMLIGILYLGQIKKYLGVILGSILFMTIAAAAVQYQWDIISFYHDIRSSGGVNMIAEYFQKGFQNSAYYAAAVAIAIFGTICMVCMREKKPYKNIARTVIVVGILIVFTANGISDTKILPKEHKDKLVGSVVELLQSVPDVPIYCVGAPNTDIKILQWELSERSIQIVEVEQLDTIKNEEAVVISPMDHVIVGQASVYENFLYSSGTIAVYANKATDTGKVLCENIIEARSVVDETEGQVDLADAVGESGYRKADGYIYYNNEYGEAAMTQGTGLELNDGIYEFTIELEIQNMQSDQIGYVLATDENGIATNAREILADDVGKKGKAVVKVEAAVENYAEPLILVYNYGNSDMIVKSITYKQISSETPRNEAEKDELRRVFEIIDSEYPRRTCIYYIDSDGSGVCGKPNIMSGDYGHYTEEECEVYQLPTWSVKYLSNKRRKVFILEKSADYMELEKYLDEFYNRYETQHFILYLRS